MRKWNKLLLCLLFTVTTFPLSAQKASEKLKQKQQELEKKIESTKSLIGSAKNNQRITIAELAIINQQISYREELLRNISQQVGKINRQIEENKSVIESLEADLKRLKEQYAQMLFYAYKHRNTYHKLMFVFAARDFNQAYLRMKYLQQYGDYRKKQVEMINRTKQTLDEKVAQLEQKRVEKQGLAKEQEKEKSNFVSDKQRQQETLSTLQKEENRLKAALDDQEKKKKQLAQEIRKAIEEEIRKQRELEQAKNRNNNKPSGGQTATSSKKGTGFTETPEIKLESTRFENNKGKLPWPVEKGEITQRFGQRPHASVKGLITNNNGVDIGTTKASKIRAVFDGTVSSIFVIPGAGKAVMISHGSYRTVYANLAEVSVAKGQEIKTKQEIGTVLSGESSISELHFEIWKITESDYVRQDPEGWLYKN